MSVGEEAYAGPVGRKILLITPFWWTHLKTSAENRATITFYTPPVALDWLALVHRVFVKNEEIFINQRKYRAIQENNRMSQCLRWPFWARKRKPQGLEQTEKHTDIGDLVPLPFFYIVSSSGHLPTVRWRVVSKNRISLRSLLITRTGLKSCCNINQHILISVLALSSRVYIFRILALLLFTQP